MNALVSRRSFIGAVPTLAAPMALLPASVLEAAASSDPILALVEARARHEAAWKAAPEGSAEDQAAWDAFRAAEDAIEGTVATTPEGLVAQIDYMKASYGAGMVDVNPFARATVDDVPVAFLDVIVAGLRGLA